MNDTPRRLGISTATALVVGSMIGTGVFTTTGFLVRDLGSAAAVLAAWVVGGLVALCGALAYAELVAALPQNGGEYQLLSRIYHPGVGFVSGWVSLVVGFSAPTAASALAFGAYLERVLPIPPMVSAIGLVVVMSALHAARVTLGGSVQNVITAGHVLLVIGFVVAGLFAGDPERITAVSSRSFGAALASPEFAVGLIYVSFAYSGWNAAAYVAGEIRRPARSLPISLLAGTLTVTVLYLALNFVFLIGAPAQELSGVLEVGHVAAERLFGAEAAVVITVVVSAGLVTTVSALLMTGPRVYEAMGRDYARLGALGKRREKTGPLFAIVLQGALALVMVVSASFDALLTYMGFTLALFSALTVAGVFVLRRREPGLERPYRTWGHPVTSLVAIGLMLWMMLYAIVERPMAALTGGVTLAIGFAIYLWVRP